MIKPSIFFLLLFHTDAYALSCKEILELHSHNTPEKIIITMMKETSSKIGKDDVLCLQENNAPTSILHAAKEITGVELPPEQSQPKKFVMTPLIKELRALYNLMQEAGHTDKSKIIPDIAKKIAKDQVNHFSPEQAAILSTMIKEAKIDISNLPLIQEQFVKTTPTDK